MARNVPKPHEMPFAFPEPLSILEICYLHALVLRHVREIWGASPLPEEGPGLDPDQYSVAVQRSLMGKFSRTLETANTHYIEIQTPQQDPNRN